MLPRRPYVFYNSLAYIYVVIFVLAFATLVLANSCSSNDDCPGNQICFNDKGIMACASPTAEDRMYQSNE